MIYRIPFCFFAVIATAIFGNHSAYAGDPHPYHISYTELSFNKKSGNFEVAICVWPTDLEKALSAQENVPVDMEQTKNLDLMMHRYIEKRFEINKIVEETDSGSKETPTALLDIPPKPRPEVDPTNAQERKTDETLDASTENKNKSEIQTKDSKPKSQIRWVGHEGDRRQVWLYFEYKGDALVDNWTIENRVFTELNEDQLNHIQWTLNEKQYETFVCEKDKIRHPISRVKLLHQYQKKAQGQRD